MHPSDTSAEAAAVQRAIWERMGPSGRAELALQMSDEVREIAVCGEMQRDPSLSRRDAELKVIRRMLGPELFDAAYRTSD